MKTFFPSLEPLFQAVRLIEVQLRARGDHEIVVAYLFAAEQHALPFEVDALRLIDVQLDVVSQQVLHIPDEFLGLVDVEEQGEVARLIEMVRVPLDEGDVGLFQAQFFPEPIGGHDAARAPADDDDLFPGISHTEYSVPC